MGAVEFNIISLFLWFISKKNSMVLVKLAVFSPQQFTLI